MLNKSPVKVYSKKRIISFDLLEKVLFFTLIFSIFVINDQKNVVYPIKVIYIVIMGISMILQNVKIKWYMLWGIFFIIYTSSSLFWSNYFDSYLAGIIWIIQAYLIYIVTVANINTRKKLTFVMSCFYYSCVLLSMRLLIMTPTHVWGVNRLGPAIGYNSNVIGMQLIIGVLTSIYIYQNKVITNKWILVITNMLFILLIILSGSRKSLLGVLVGVILYFVITNKNSIVKNIVVIISIPIILYVIYYSLMNIELIYEIIGYRMEALTRQITGSEDSLRIELIHEGLELFSKKPILGYGVNGFSRASKSGLYSHNNYIEMLVNFGLLGSILYYSLYIYLLYKLIRFIRDNGLEKSNSSIFLSIMGVIIFLEVGLVSYRDLYILLPIAAVTAYINIQTKRYRNDF